MLIPLTHEQMTVQRLPWITIGIMLANVFIFLYTHPQTQRDENRLYEVIDELHALAAANPGMSQEDFSNEEDLGKYQRLVERLNEINRSRLFGRYGFVPSRQEWPDVMSSIFLHGGWMHLLGNMYLLWLCGCSIEDLWGRPVYALIYLSSGLVACMAHAAAFPLSEAPLVGASGAIAGLMGAFLVRLYATRIRLFYMFWIHWGTFYAPAWIMLPLWLMSQLFYAVTYREGSPIAFWAHVGGFVFGASVALFIKLTLVEEAFIAPAIEQKTTLFAQNPKVTSALHLIDSGKHQEALRPLLVAIRDNPDDIDALDLLAQAYQSLGNNKNAGQAHARRVRSHLKRREKDLAASAYFDMVECSRDASLRPRDSLALAPTLVEDDRRDEAMVLYQRVIDSVSDPSIKLRASLALADLFITDRQGKRALQVLSAVAPLAETLPEWKLHVEEKLEATRKLVPALSHSQI
jgi:membrane associated rhomboid family serine protease